MIDQPAEECQTQLTEITEGPELSSITKSDEKPKRARKKKVATNWKEKYEKFYKNRKKFSLDIIRSEEGPFLFKIQLQYIWKRKKKQVWIDSESNPQTSDGNSIPGDKLKCKVLNFFKSSQTKNETENEPTGQTNRLMNLNYDKIKIWKPKNDNVKIFVTVFSREDGVQIYDYFYKLRSKKFNSAVYLITSTDVLKKHTMIAIMKHKEKRKPLISRVIILSLHCLFFAFQKLNHLNQESHWIVICYRGTKETAWRTEKEWKRKATGPGNQRHRGGSSRNLVW